jgi:hypothetical protein
MMRTYKDGIKLYEPFDLPKLCSFWLELVKVVGHRNCHKILVNDYDIFHISALNISRLTVAVSRLLYKVFEQNSWSCQ